LWVHVVPHFEKFLAELDLTEEQRTDAYEKATRVAQSLAAKYYPDQDFDPNVAMVSGSVGKNTAIRPPSDVDVVFFLPRPNFFRIDHLEGNKQSQLLQEVKRALLVTYPRTDIRGDGPVVKVPFDSYFFEVLPVFVCDDGDLLTAHTSDGGSWLRFNPYKEAQQIHETDGRSLGKATNLIKMLKAWRNYCNVDVKSICLEVAANVFIDQWANKSQTMYFYDWMIRDFFSFMLRELANDGWTRPSGNANRIYLGDNWQNKARAAYQAALNACQYEGSDDDYNASLEWRRIFGPQFPLDTLTTLYRSIRALS
jgi:Second Messenger Oligonucleotide or Dinucleotide Synthetase domain